MIRFHSKRQWLVAGLVLIVPSCMTAPRNTADFVKKLDVESASQPVELHPDVASNACVVTARELAKNGYDSDAIAEYEHARKLNPLVKGIARDIAVLYGRQRNRQKALVEFERALQESPKDADLLNDFGYFQMELDDWGEAEKWLRKALDLAPAHERARVNLGLALAYQGRIDESLAVFKPAVGEAAAHSNVAMILAQLGQTDAARHQFQRASDLDPTLQQPQVALAVLERGDEVEQLPETSGK